MQGRAGGRAFSMRGLGPYGDLSVDPGGYRTVSFRYIIKNGRLLFLIDAHVFMIDP